MISVSLLAMAVRAIVDTARKRYISIYIRGKKNDIFGTLLLVVVMLQKYRTQLRVYAEGEKKHRLKGLRNNECQVSILMIKGRKYNNIFVL